MAIINLNNFISETEWSELYNFPCAPKKTVSDPIDAYFQNLIINGVLAFNDIYPKLIILKFLKISNNSKIMVMCERESSTCEDEGFKPWLIVEIRFDNGLFFHCKLASHFEKDDADEAFLVIQTCRPKLFLDNATPIDSDKKATLTPEENK